MGNHSLFLSESIGCQLKEDRHENRWECPDPGHNEDPTRGEGGELAVFYCNTQVRITLEIEASCEPYFEGDVSLTSFSSFTFLEIQDFGNHRWRVANVVVVDISCGL